MGDRYSVNGTRQVASPTKTLIGITSSTSKRPRLYDFTCGSTATPADNALEWIWQRYTAAGTSTSVTPTALDPGAPSALFTSGANHTVEPTYTSGAVFWDVPINQRSTQRLVVFPQSEIILPATGGNGAGLQPVHASFTGNVTATAWVEE